MTRLGEYVAGAARMRQAFLKLLSFPRRSYTLALMPIYEYECLACGHQFEYLVLATSPAATCPSCQGKELKTLISMCTMSSESTRQANLKVAQRKAAAGHKERQHEDHKHLHEHFDHP